MSLINQMLQDLEKRRIEAVPVSPFGGVSPSGNAPGSDHKINYSLLGIILVLAVVVAFMLGANGNHITQILPVAIQPMAADATPVVPNRPVSFSQETPSQTPKLSSPAHSESMSPRPSSPAQASVTSEPQVMPVVKPVKAERTVADADDSAKLSAGRNTISVTPAPEVVSVAAVTETSGANNTTLAANTVVTEHKASVVSLASPQQSVENRVADQPESRIQKQDRPLTDQQRSELVFQEAITLLEGGQEEAAITTLQAVLELYPAHGRAREILASLLINRGRALEASGLLETGLTLNPRAHELARLYARILLSEGDTTQAIAVLEKAAPPVQVDPEYYALLGAIYQRAGQYGQAAEMYEGLVRVRAGVANWWLGLGLAQESSGSDGKAVLAYNRARTAGGLSSEVSRFVTERITVLNNRIAAANTEKDDDKNKKPQSIFEGQF